MKYDFTSIIDRRGKDALAIDFIGAEGSSIPGPKEGFDAIPMWVADMNFPTAPGITEQIIRRAEHPCFGYFRPADEYYNAILAWQSRRNGLNGLTKECIGYENGVLGGVMSALRVFCSPGDNVLLHSPTYIGFTNSLLNSGYRIVHSPLTAGDDGIYRMDFEDMERKIAENNIHACIFCSPHNPTGRVWERREVEAAMDIFRKYNVWVISDEIWSDILLDGHKHVPLLDISDDARERTVALYAPSKTFNLAGLVGSYHVICNPWLRDRVRKEASLAHYNSMNVLSMHALIGAYNPDGEEWLTELCAVLSENARFAVSFIEENFEGVKVSHPQGTYMLFLDCTDWCVRRGRTLDELLKAGYDVGVAWQDGRSFNGPCHIRMNLALPRSRVEEAFDRLRKYVF